MSVDPIGTRGLMSVDPIRTGLMSVDPIRT
jgi:hypothetical protein